MDRMRCERPSVQPQESRTWPWSMGTVGLPRAEEGGAQMNMLARSCCWLLRGQPEVGSFPAQQSGERLGTCPLPLGPIRHSTCSSAHNWEYKGTVIHSDWRTGDQPGSGAGCAGLLLEGMSAAQRPPLKMKSY